MMFAPAYVFANAASGLGGWSVGSIAAEAGVATINATKEAIINGASRTVNSFAKVTPAPADLARGIGRFGAVLAVTTAIDLLLDGVSWVLDPANNRVKYWETPVNNSQYLWQISIAGTTKTYSTFGEACNAAVAAVEGHPPITEMVATDNGQTVECRSAWGYDQANRVVNPNYDPDIKPEEKYLPYDVVGAEIAKNAAAGDAAANDFVKETVAADLADAEQGKPLAYPSVPQQLDANAGVEPKEGDNDITKETKPNTADPDAPPIEKFTLPGFCSWAAFICDAMNISNTNSGKVATNSTRIATDTESVKTATQTTATQTEETKKAVTAGTTQAHTDAEKQLAETTKTATATRELADAIKEEVPERDDSDTDIDIPTTETPQAIQLDFGGTCPQPKTFSFNFIGQTQTFEFDLSGWCQAFAYAKPAILLIGAYQASMIVAGRTEEES
ncbi:virulence factor TspB C-terminal domain-related protein [Alkanindiges illinoisensis]|uniref:virulence factor TspB C-terminal domain-related protein n=1 Tax=Alkanindiges illinoisensis TaxID=197183 RepID=UPI00047DC73E|nr:virulence factor TspB C-terminal domain-related protein [Alkanindiges illinoisensis]